MTVKQLIKELLEQDPDAICVYPGPDHSYCRLRGVGATEAVVEGRYLSEWSGNDFDYPETPKKVNVVVFGD